jgi:UDPglucose 6-dehydrogenase
LLSDIEWCQSGLEAAKGADALVVLTEWNEFRALDLKGLRQIMKGNVLIDLRNMYTKAAAREAGFIYYGIGRVRPTPITNRVPSSWREFEANGRNIRRPQ